MNVARKDTSYGVSFTKDNRDHKLKVDLYAAWMLAYGALMDYREEESFRAAKVEPVRGGFFRS